MEKKNSVSFMTIFFIILSCAYIAIGLCKILLPEFNLNYVVYCAAGLAELAAIILIVIYFTTGKFKNIGSYDFSAGVLCSLSGILILIKVNDIINYFFLFLGVCLLITAIIKLQNAVDLKALDCGAWIAFLVISFVFIAAAVVIILNPLEWVTDHTDYVYYLLIGDGAISIISTIVLAIAIRTHKKQAKRDQEEREMYKKNEAYIHSIPEKNEPEKEDSTKEE